MIFSPKQIKILDLIKEGKSNKKIAAVVEPNRVGKNGIRYDLEKLYDLSGMGTRLELALWWLHHRQEILELGKR